ncbi:MAG: hypothetical protein IKF51_03415, partial [Solobacterium sp.]|nr:hypothetical protein [Solobacterium sp.]
MAKTTKKRLNANIVRRFRKILITFISMSMIFGITFLSAFMIALKGPSPTFSNLIVSTFMETRRGVRLIHMFLSDEDIEAMLSKNQIYYTEEITVDAEDEFIIPESQKDDIEIIDVSGATFNGKLMIVRDPSRMALGVNTLMGSENAMGFLVQDYVLAEGAVAGINAGGFDDPNGMGDGSIPYGVVIKDGELVAGTMDQWVS